MNVYFLLILLFNVSFSLTAKTDLSHYKDHNSHSIYSASDSIITGTVDILKVYPEHNSIINADSLEINIKFGSPIDSTTLNDSTILIRGDLAGKYYISSFNYNTVDSSVSVIIAAELKIPDKLTITLTSGILDFQGYSITPYTWDFKLQPKSSSSKFRLRHQFDAAGPLSNISANDLDQDGDVDLLCLSRAHLKLFIYKNQGNNEFILSKELNTSFGPLFMLTGDYDNDNDIDIVIAFRNSTIEFYRNDGSNNFDIVKLPNSGYLGAFKQADLDGDGDLDFITKSYLIINDGDFVFRVSSHIPQISDYGLVCTDIDNDGDIDLINSPGIAINEGNCQFSYPGIPLFKDVLLAFDPDKDGDSDLLCKGNLTGTELWINDSNLGFSIRKLNVPGFQVLRASANDFNGDGYEDICFYGQYKYMVAIGKDGLEFETRSSGTSFEFVPTDVQFDYDNDGDLDLIFAGYDQTKVSLYENREHYNEISLSAGKFDFGLCELDQTYNSSFYIRNHGTLPLIIDSVLSSNRTITISSLVKIVEPSDSMIIDVSFTPDQWKVYEDSISIKSNDTVNPVIYYHVSGKGKQKVIESVFPAFNDFNHSADTISVIFREDMIPLSLNNETIKVFGSKTGYSECQFMYNSSLNKVNIAPKRKFIPDEIITVVITDKIQMVNNYPVEYPFIWSFRAKASEGKGVFASARDVKLETSANFLCGADLNNDGAEEIVVQHSMSNYISIIRSESRTGLLSTIKFGNMMESFDITCSDFNSDGHIDIAVCSMGSIQLFRNDGDFKFTNLPIKVNNDFSRIAPGDYDGDGDIDFISFSYNYEGFGLFINETDFNFSLKKIPFKISNASKILSSDIENDGDFDIIFSDFSNKISVLINGGGDFNLVPLQLSENMILFGISDLNKDGYSDLFGKNPDNLKASIMLNKGKLVFEKFTAETSPDPYRILSADFNSDGYIDLVIGDKRSKMSVYLNQFPKITLFSELDITLGNEMITGDFNGDGSIDLAYSNAGNSSIGWFSNTPKKSFTLSSYNIIFKDINVGTTAIYELAITNNGLDTLHVDSVYFERKLFSSDIKAFQINPGITKLINVFFTSDSSGTFRDTLVISTGSLSLNKVAVEATTILTAMNDETEIPKEYSLKQNYPNPFNPTTVISWQIPVSAPVTLKLFDILGKEVATLVDENREAGYYTTPVDGSKLSCGVYIFQLNAGSFSQSRKMVLMK